jgi:hypothetical protein
MGREQPTLSRQMIGASEVAPIIVTRGDVTLAKVLAPFDGYGFADGYVWNNGSEDENLSVFGRYAAIEHVKAPVILVVDDDVALGKKAVDGLLAAYRPRKLVANMPLEYRERYTDSCLVGFGAIFDRGLPAKAFKRFRQGAPLTDNEWFLRTADVVFSVLTPFELVDLPFEYLPQTRAPNRMFRQPGNHTERQSMLAICRKVRDGK